MTLLRAVILLAKWLRFPEEVPEKRHCTMERMERMEQMVRMKRMVRMERMERSAWSRWCG